MKYFRLKYADGRIMTVSGKTTLDVIKRYDLCTRENVTTRIVQLTGEQEAIARDNEIPDDGFADGGESYTPEEMEAIHGVC